MYECMPVRTATVLDQKAELHAIVTTAAATAGSAPESGTQLLRFNMISANHCQKCSTAADLHSDDSLAAHSPMAKRESPTAPSPVAGAGSYGRDFDSSTRLHRLYRSFLLVVDSHGL